MQDLMIQVEFITWRSDGEGPNFLRQGELVNPFTIDECGVNVESDTDEIDVLCVRSNGREEIFRIKQVQVDAMLPVARRNGRWVVVE